ncbi:hypothetical protein GQS40_09875|uniref:Uncharacterized protein n=1 Tax=Leuconostoc lactis TaxID=1246 RepID=A0A6L7ACQ6_LEULA|nr:hypothetical protein [Leuconostoc lactis]
MREAAKAVPLERLLVETDAPYLAPTPFRGKDNEPAFVKYVLDSLAETLDMTPKALTEITRTNARALAKKYDLPVIIHNREAFDDVYAMLKASGVTKGVMHSFSGTPEQALAFVDLGMHISFSGVVTFKKDAQAHNNIYAVLGFQPEDTVDFDAAAAQTLEAQLQADKVVGVGETGLDYYWETAPHDVQKQAFETHQTMSK